MSTTTTPSIDFSHNWNNKLMCVCFTTIRLRNDNKYQVGGVYPITYQFDTVLGPAKIADIKHFKLSQLTEYMSRIDTGYPKEETEKILRNMYKKKNVDWDVQELSFILLVQPATAIRYIAPTRLKKEDKQIDLFEASEKTFSH